jgi:hypothetical protein
MHQILMYATELKKNRIRSGVLTQVVMKSSVLWHKTPCNPLEVNHCLEGRCRFHLQGQKNKPSKKPEWCRWQAESVYFERSTRRYNPEDNSSGPV